MKRAQKKSDGQAKADSNYEDGQKLKEFLDAALAEIDELKADNEELQQKLETSQLEFASYKDKVKDELAKELSDQYRREIEDEVIRAKTEKEAATEQLKLVKQHFDNVFALQAQKHSGEVLTLIREIAEMTERINRTDSQSESALNLLNTGNSGNQSKDHPEFDQEENYRQTMEGYVRKLDEMNAKLNYFSTDVMNKTRECKDLASKNGFLQKERDEARNEIIRIKDKNKKRKSIFKELIARFINLNGSINVIKKCFNAFKKNLANFNRKADEEHMKEHFQKKAIIRIIRKWHKSCHVARSKAQHYFLRTAVFANKVLVSQCFWAFYRAQTILDEEDMARIEGSGSLQPLALIQDTGRMVPEHQVLSADERQLLEAKFSELALRSGRQGSVEDPPYESSGASSPAKLQPVSDSVLKNAAAKEGAVRQRRAAKEQARCKLQQGRRLFRFIVSTLGTEGSKMYGADSSMPLPTWTRHPYIHIYYKTMLYNIARCDIGF